MTITIGCREGDCGACTILVGELQNGESVYRSMTSCLMPLGNAHQRHIVTIEGLNNSTLSPVQEAIVEEGGTQCGFCTVGFVLSLSGFSLNASKPDFTSAIASIDGNICRCTGYKSLERAAKRISEDLEARNESDPMQWLVQHRYLPKYFLGIKERLSKIEKIPSLSSSANGSNILVGGGTDLWVQRPEEMAEAPIQHVFGKSDHKHIRIEQHRCIIPAAATAEDLQASQSLQQIFPEIRAYMKLVSSTPIRNMGTLAGNLVNASPIGDLTIFFLALDSDIHLNHNGNKRKMKLAQFYKGYKQMDKAKEEVVEAISFNIPEKQSHFNFEKVCKRTHLDIASVNSACLIQIEDGFVKQAHLSAGGVGPIPMYLHQARAALIGKKISSQTIKEAAEVMQKEISPISDARGSADYKRLLLRQLFFAHILKFFPEEVELGELLTE